jgi:acyl-CoA dehydrogenase
VLVHDTSKFWLTRYGTETQKQQYLPGIVKGETVCALGITEPGTGSDMAALATRAVRQGDHYLLTGSKTFITNGVYGDLYFVAARTGEGSAERRHDGISMFLVERGLPGFSVSRKLDKMGMRASDTAELSLEECRVPAESLLGVEGRGFQQLAAGLQRERIMAAVLALSGAAQALEDSASYLRGRHAVGAPLAPKTALRPRRADMATRSGARQLVTGGLALAGRRECRCRVDGCFRDRAANRGPEAAQMHALRYMREPPSSVFFRDVRLWPIARARRERCARSRAPALS